MAKPKVLIIDDEIDISETLAYILRAKGFDPIIASDGSEGIKRAARENPDIVLLDIKMPVMDGYEVCVTMKKEENTRTIPIIMITSNSDTDSVVKAHKLGASDYIVKPFNIPTLLNKIRRFV